MTRAEVNSNEWQRYRRKIMPALRARADDLCERCHTPIDFDAGRGRLGPSVDHLHPRAHGGELIVPIDELALVHVGCNSRRANQVRRLGAPALVTPAVELEPELPARAVHYPRRDRSDDRRTRAGMLADHPRLFAIDDDETSESFGSAITRSPLGASISPKTPAKRRIAESAGDFGELVPARLETPRPSDVTGSYGAEARGWIREYLRSDLRPWQAYALERILEHRADGSLRWRRVIVTVSRQSGKSVLARGGCGWRLGAGDLFGEPQAILHVANLRETAALVWRHAADTLAVTLDARVRRGNGQESIALADGSTWRLAASTLDGGVGSSVSLAFVDEAWRISRDVVDGSIAPTMLERASPQLWLVSTAGDGGSDLLGEDRAAAIETIADPDAARILLLEWSAPAEADPDDREAWRLASPHWSPARLEALEQAHATTPENPWRTMYLNQWVRSARSWLTASQWRAGERPELVWPSSPAGTIAIEAHMQGFPFGLVHALALDSGDVLVRGRCFDTRRAMWAYLDELARERRGLTLLHSAAFVGHVPSSLRGVTVRKVGMPEQVSSYSPTVATAGEGRLLHAGDAELREHVLSAATVTIPDRGTALSSKHSTGPIYLARALVWAVGHELRPEARRRAMIVSSRTAAA
jgi:hypothetical protein